MLIVLLSLILAVGVIILLIESRPNLFMFQLINKIFGKEGRGEYNKELEGNRKSDSEIKLEKKETKNV